jgi:transcriptional regulator with XRE-family HTH domain
MTDQEGWERLGRAVKARRERLGLTQEEVASRGGPSTATLRNIEGAQGTGYRARTLYQLDEALGWTRGCAVAIAEGEAPWFDLSRTFEEFVERVVRDVSGEIGRGDDFPVGTPDTPPEPAKPRPASEAAIRPGDLTTDEIADVLTRLVAELHARANDSRGGGADAATNTTAPDDYGLAARRGTPSKLQQDAAEPDPNVDPPAPDEP